MNKLDLETKNIIDDNIDKIGSIFPNVIVESENGQSVDFDLLKQELSSVLIEGNKEKYQLTWPGKKEAIINANTSTTKTLRPVKEKSIDFDNTKNIYIEGDNLEVLKILQESYLNKIKCIYIDPPYNRGSDLIYQDNFSNNINLELIQSGQIDDFGNKLVTNLDTNGKFHSNWISMMYSRLKLSRNLLKEDGIIFISIDDNELYNLKKICDEIFGENNFVNCITVKSSEATGVKMTHADKKMPKIKEYILMYTKQNVPKLNYDNILIPIESWGVNYKNVVVGVSKEELEEIRMMMKFDDISDIQLKRFDDIVKKIKLVGFKDVESKWDKLTNEDKLLWKYENSYRIVREVSSKSAKKLADEKSIYNLNDFFGIKTAQGKLYFIKNHYNREAADPNIKLLFAIDYLMVNPCDLWTDIKTTRLDQEGDVSYNNGKKPVKLLNRLLSMVTEKNDIVMDYFSGSATTGHSVIDLNSKDMKKRKFILVQINENLDKSYNIATKDNKKNIKQCIDFLDLINVEHKLSNIGIERIKRAANKIKVETNADIDYGFRVYRVDSSNMTDVYYQPNDLKQTELRLFEENIKEDRNSEDILTQVILDLGLTLDLKIENKNINNNNIYFVDNNLLIACFDTNININMIDEIVKYNPSKVVFRDSSFTSDNDRINVEEKFKKYSPETEVNII